MNDWIPLLQTLVWPLLILIIIIWLRVPISQLGRAMITRVQGGSGLEVSVGSWFKAKVDSLQDLKPISPADASAAAKPASEVEWTKIRGSLPKDSRALHLVHVIGPSGEGPGWFEVFVYLLGHKRAEFGYPADIADVAYAEFYLGKYWGNTVFRVENTHDGKHIGLTTSAYGPTLCVCQVHFTDGHTAVLTRYLDFEMAPQQR